MSDIPDEIMNAAKACLKEAVSDERVSLSVMLAWEDATTAALLDAIARALMAADEAATKRERERCARICDEQSTLFSSERYAVDQPFSSFSERFACAEIKAAILKGEA